MTQKDIKSNVEPLIKNIKFNLEPTHLKLFQRAVEKLKTCDTSFTKHFETFDCTKNSDALREKVKNSFLTGETSELQQNLVGTLLNQMLSKSGIKKHGEKVEEALHNEFLQLYDMDVFVAIKNQTCPKNK